ncbi:MAG: hypothetical protein WB507_11720 [Solirubrobacterales bacterium]
MEIVLAALAFDQPGGMQTYILTLAPHLERLGHGVTIYAPDGGQVADLARSRGLRVSDLESQLPPSCDAVISSDAVSALVMADRFPAAVRGIIVHGGDFDLHLPPAHEGVVSFAVAMNGVVQRRVEASAGAPPVTRLRQPIEIAHFFAAGPVREQAERVLLLGNYLSGRRRDALVDVCERAGLEWRQVGASGEIALDPRPAILEADIVIAQGRAALEGMACGRAVWVFGPSGGDGWVTADTYEAIEADGLRGRASGAPIDAEAFGRALADYRPQMGEVNRELAVLHHSPYDHAVAVVGLLEGRSKGPAPGAPLREMARLVRTHHDAQSRVAAVALELRALHGQYQMLARENARHAEESARHAAELDACRAQVAELLARLHPPPGLWRRAGGYGKRRLKRVWRGLVGG